MGLYSGIMGFGDNTLIFSGDLGIRDHGREKQRVGMAALRAFDTVYGKRDLAMRSDD